jgi:hypothetical protein
MKMRCGQSLLEVSLALVVIVPILVILCDLALVVLTVQANHSTCREAARLAASGDPSTANLRALAIIARANRSANGFISNFALDGLETTVKPAQLASLNPFGGTITGSVTASTHVELRPFLVQWLYAGKPLLIFHSRQSYPFTYVVPNTSQAQP